MKTSLFYSVSTVLLFILTCQPGSVSGQTGKHHLPVHYSFDRFYLTPVTKTGDTLRFYTDTGGGTNMLYESTVEKLDLQIEWRPFEDDSVRFVSMPSFVPEASIPPPVSPEPPYEGKLLVVPAPDIYAGDSGFLGRLWFAHRAWELKYPQKTFSLLDGADWTGRSTDHRVSLAFQVNDDGTPTTYFPRITIRVEGDPVELLFDTGATVSLSKQAAGILYPDPDIPKEIDIGTSFIAESVFKKWQEEYPEWKGRLFGWGK